MSTAKSKALGWRLHGSGEQQCVLSSLGAYVIILVYQASYCTYLKSLQCSSVVLCVAFVDTIIPFVTVSLAVPPVH